ncbi:beta-aspartyl-peptidase [Clostridium sp. BJN0001]|uniref:beta-aspartyl-peptidase n=1 Tax=Clostridium sp. BJN0001 TaxID=2930219 RepID=UPI001FD31BF2|nr:beta-aspartyl-peptidase [Clostridium sp. BJN0001]
MVTFIKNCDVFAPEYIGKKNILVSGRSIEGIFEENEDVNIPGMNVIYADGNYMFPGLIDSHVHITGGGGESSFSSRTTEIDVSEIVKYGVTTVVGCRGTDDVGRSMESLISKAKELKEKGISAYCYTGSYSIPAKTMTRSIKRDIMMIDEIIGTGEIAVSDNRSSNPTYEELLKIISETRVAGLLSGKAGVVNIHVGDGKDKLKLIKLIINSTEIPAYNILPTHINRNGALFSEAKNYIKHGGVVDITTSCDKNNMAEGELRAAKALKELLDSGADIQNITFSSDGNGSMPEFDCEGHLIKMGRCSLDSLYTEVISAINDYGISIEKALSVVTKNPAQILKLRKKGRIRLENDADFLIVDKNNFEIKYVFANGKCMLNKKEK